MGQLTEEGGRGNADLRWCITSYYKGHRGNSHWGNSSVALGDVNWFSQLIVSRLCQLVVTIGSKYSEHLLNDFLLTTNNRALLVLNLGVNINVYG